MNGRLLPESLIADVTEHIKSVLGLDFPREKWGDFERALKSAYHDMGYNDIESCAQGILWREIEREELEILAAALTVGETYFFREPGSLSAFEYSILPEIIREKQRGDRRLRIWSAGCATGEEPYTIAMILKRSIPAGTGMDISLTATDINMKFIKKALSGSYTKWSFRNVPESVINSYFKKNIENRFDIDEKIRNMVSFSYLNLMDESYPSVLNNTNAVDVIFCRNVLMYFSRDNITSVVRKFYNSLNTGGYLIVSQTELSEFYFGDFESVKFPEAIVYRKNPGKKFSEPGIEPLPAMKHPTPDLFFEREHLLNDIKIPAVEQISPPRETKKPQPPAMDEIRRLFNAGDYDAAQKQLLPLISDGQGNPEASSLLARIYANRGMLGEAEKLCRDAVAADGMNSAYHYLLATINREMGKINDALASLRKAIYLDNDFAIAYYTVGVIAQGQGNRGEALKNFNAALSILKKMGHDQDVPESEGLPAGRLADIIESIKTGL